MHKYGSRILVYQILVLSTILAGVLSLRQFVTIASLVALFMYAGFASLQGMALPVMDIPPRPVLSAGTLVPLNRALEAGGASLTEARITGWVRADRPQAAQQARAQMGLVLAGQTRIDTLSHEGGQFVTVAWYGDGARATEWPAVFEALASSLGASGGTPTLSVTLTGERAGGEPEALVSRALDSLGATQRQPWSGPQAASAAAVSPYLSPSPLGVNVQVAARRDAKTGRVTVWAGWPTLNQEY